MITDYSAVSAEASLLELPVYFYTPDLEEYAGEAGLNVNPEELFPEITFRNAEELMKTVGGEADGSYSERIREKLAGSCRGESAKSIACLATETTIINTDAAVPAEKSSKLSDFLARCAYTVNYLGAKIDPGLILFESKQTKAFEGDVKSLYEAICADKKYEDCRFAWAVADPDGENIPGGVSLLVVKYGSTEHMQVHARARAIVSDGPASCRIRLRTEQAYLVADSSAKEQLRRVMDI